MFVERLTRKQVKDFLKGIYPETLYKYEFNYIEIFKEFSVTVYTISNSTEIDHFTLYDFDVLYITWSRKLWIKYLYKIFGEEYKVAYLAECAKIFE